MTCMHVLECDRCYEVICMLCIKYYCHDEKICFALTFCSERCAKEHEEAIHPC